MAAVMIPVFLLLSALVFDVGTWFTHKRQLQNRADAGALAAGVEYANRWAACVQGDALTKSAVSAAIEDAARRYAGDPEVAGTLYNTEVTDQTRVNVELNSTSGNFDQGTSWNDPGIGGTGPCDPQPNGDEFSAAGNYWLDVKVKEVDQPTLFGAFGLNLLRNRAQARVELKELVAGDDFIPIAVPEQLIQQAQVRYIPYCNGTPGSYIAKVDLGPLPTGLQNATSGTTLWGPLNGSGVVQPVSITWPTDCPGGDIQVGVEVRIAGVPTDVVQIDEESANGRTCQQLVAARYADCWTRLSNVRVYRSIPNTEPWLSDVELYGNPDPACAPDAYFAKPSNQSSCTYTASARIQFHGAILGGGTTIDDFQVSIGGTPATPTGGGGIGGSPAVWNSQGSITNSAAGRSDVVVSWSWTDRDPTHTRGATGPPCRNGGNNPCRASGSFVAHSTFLSDGQNAGIVDLVRTTIDAPQSGGVLGGPIHSVEKGDVSVNVYPIVGLNSSLYLGQRRVLRVSGPQSNQSVDCEPNTGGQGHDFTMFAYGCSPWYGVNDYTNPTWWNPTTKECPDRNGLLAQPNDMNSPWRCVVKAPGFSPNVVADGIAAAIGNCENIQNNSCQRYQCVNRNYYDPGDPGAFAAPENPNPGSRVVNIFIVPYGAYKNTGPQASLPILNFASFYVSGWSGQGGAGQNPCNGDPDGPSGPIQPEESTSGGEIVGYWVAWARYGPSDPDSICEGTELRPCTPVLTR